MVKVRILAYRSGLRNTALTTQGACYPAGNTRRPDSVDLAVRLEIWADLVCPWCYIGQARFQRALAGFPYRDQVRVAYRSFELDPGFPRGEPVSVTGMLAAKYGMSTDQAETAERRVAGLAAAEDLPFEASRPYGNTFDAHRLLHLAGDRGCQQAVLAALYRAYFGAGRSIFDTKSVIEAAGSAGLDADEADAALTDGAFADDVRADEARARELRISGVPYFVADGRLAVPGCQAVETYSALLARAWADAGSTA